MNKLAKIPLNEEKSISLNHTNKFMRISFLFFLAISSTLFSQSNTEIYVMDIAPNIDGFEILNFSNISNNDGYDSQPSFIDNNKLLYAGTVDNQTEIIFQDLNTNAAYTINASTQGSEYSPQQFPEGNEIAAVRLDTNGLQRLYAYDSKLPENGTSRLLFNNLEVAYYAFHDKNRIIASILSGEQLDLVIANLITKEVTPLAENSGRSIHNIPASNSLSYTSLNKNGSFEVFIIDIDDDKESYFVCQLPIGIQDHCWLNENVLLIGSGAKLYKYDLFGEQEWIEIADLSSYNISEISRITVSPNGKKIALVATSKTRTPSQIINTYSTALNSNDSDTATAIFADDISVLKYPNTLQYKGKRQLKKNYLKLFKPNKNSSITVQNSIIKGNTIINKEQLIINNKSVNRIAIYTIENDLITSMTSIPSSKISQDSETIINNEIAAYNDRNILAFAETFSEDVIINNYPNSPIISSNTALENGYRPFFNNTIDLHCTIKNRIIHENIVIDEEIILMNGTYKTAIAIYTIDDFGKINTVTFMK